MQYPLVSYDLIDSVNLGFQKLKHRPLAFRHDNQRQSLPSDHTRMYDQEPYPTESISGSSSRPCRKDLRVIAQPRGLPSPGITGSPSWPSIPITRSSAPSYPSTRGTAPQPIDEQMASQASNMVYVDDQGSTAGYETYDHHGAGGLRSQPIFSGRSSSRRSRLHSSLPGGFKDHSRQMAFGQMIPQDSILRLSRDNAGTSSRDLGREKIYATPQMAFERPVEPLGSRTSSRQAGSYQPENQGYFDLEPVRGAQFWRTPLRDLHFVRPLAPPRQAVSTSREPAEQYYTKDEGDHPSYRSPFQQPYLADTYDNTQPYYDPGTIGTSPQEFQDVPITPDPRDAYSQPYDHNIQQQHEYRYPQQYENTPNVYGQPYYLNPNPQTPLYRSNLPLEQGRPLSTISEDQQALSDPSFSNHHAPEPNEGLITDIPAIETPHTDRYMLDNEEWKKLWQTRRP